MPPDQEIGTAEAVREGGKVGEGSGVAKELSINDIDDSSLVSHLLHLKSDNSEQFRAESSPTSPSGAF